MTTTPCLQRVEASAESSAPCLQCTSDSPRLVQRVSDVMVGRRGNVQLASAGVVERPLVLLSDDCHVQRIPDAVVVQLDVACEERPVGADALTGETALLVEVRCPG